MSDDRERKIIASVHNVSEHNKHKVRRFVETVWNQGRLDLIDELVADDYIGRVPWLQLPVVGHAGVREVVASHRRAYPNLHIEIEDEVAEDDRVVTRWRATASPGDAGCATGVTGCCEGISITRLLAGKQVDNHTAYTRLTAVHSRSNSRTTLPAPSAPQAPKPGIR